MTGTWFECKVRYEKVMDNGMNKKITESYLVDAVSFTEAEARIVEELAPLMTGEFEITEIKKARYTEVIPCDDESADKWFKCKLNYITIDEKYGTEKKQAVYMLVQAATLQDAVISIEEEMSQTMVDYEIASVTDTNIMDVYPYRQKASRTADENALNSILPEGQITEVTIYNKVYTVDKTGGRTKVTPKDDTECSRQTNTSSSESKNG